jgi:uncharacterized protein
MLTGLDWEVAGQQLMLLPEKAVYWKNERVLIVADLHIGKVGHFRKAGIPIPKLMEQEDLAVLSDLLRVLNPLKVLFLGDLFHSELNDDWNWLKLWRQLFADLEIILVLGNHDILQENHYLEAGFAVCKSLVMGPFSFTHDPVDRRKIADSFNFAGHIHPGVKLFGKGRQSVVLPAFCFGEKDALLPAFGKFTGTFCVDCDQYNDIFPVVNQRVIKIS